LEQKKGKNKIWLERKFVFILIHTPFGLNFFNRLANTKAARIYAGFSIYLMPLITALGIFLIVTSLILVFSNAGARAGQRDLGPQSNLLIPGLNPYLPWTYGWIALVITIIIHEAGHGIVARVHNIKVDSTGLLLILGLPIGAFVNIAQEELARSTLKQKSAILTAGPLSNMILVAVSLIGLYFIVSTLSPIPTNTPPQHGVLVMDVGDHTLAESIGLSKGSIIETVAGRKIHNIEDLGKFLSSNLGNRVGIMWIDQTGHQINQFVTLPKHLEANHGILGISITGVAPDPAQALRSYKNAFSLSSNPSSHFILLLPPTIGAGVQSVPYSNLMAPNYHSSVLGSAFAPLANLLYWLMFVNFNVAIFNALPIGPFDGGQLYNSVIQNRLGSKSNQVKNVSLLVSLVMIAMVAITVFSPWLIR
jgi:membrane-associated protease RseP (regulator of RpoE activity)